MQNDPVHAAHAEIVRAHRRVTIRHVAAFLAAATATIYLLIGFSVVNVVQVPAGQDPNVQLYFGLPAALAYAFGAGLLMVTDRRVLWILGAVLQVMVIAMYLAVSVNRVPAFEGWGITLRVLQALLLGALLYLAVTPRESIPSPRGVVR